MNRSERLATLRRMLGALALSDLRARVQASLYVREQPNQEASMKRMKRVIVESPFKGDVERNKLYLERCLRDCVLRGESPYASHKMLTDCLDDDDPKEREMGITAGYAWWMAGDLIVFYVDLGWSAGMTRAWERCRKEGIPYETRALPLY